MKRFWWVLLFVAGVARADCPLTGSLRYDIDTVHHVVSIMPQAESAIKWGTWKSAELRVFWATRIDSIIPQLQLTSYVKLGAFDKQSCGDDRAFVWMNFKFTPSGIQQLRNSMISGTPLRVFSWAGSSVGPTKAICNGVNYGQASLSIKGSASCPSRPSVFSVSLLGNSSAEPSVAASAAYRFCPQYGACYPFACGDALRYWISGKGTTESSGLVAFVPHKQAWDLISGTYCPPCDYVGARIDRTQQVKLSIRLDNTFWLPDGQFGCPYFWSVVDDPFYGNVPDGGPMTDSRNWILDDYFQDGSDCLLQFHAFDQPGFESPIFDRLDAVLATGVDPPPTSICYWYGGQGPIHGDVRVTARVILPSGQGPCNGQSYKDMYWIANFRDVPNGPLAATRVEMPSVSGVVGDSIYVPVYITSNGAMDQSWDGNYSFGIPINFDDTKLHFEHGRMGADMPSSTPAFYYVDFNAINCNFDFQSYCTQGEVLGNHTIWCQEYYGNHPAIYPHVPVYHFQEMVLVFTAIATGVSTVRTICTDQGVFNSPCPGFGWGYQVNPGGVGFGPNIGTPWFVGKNDNSGFNLTAGWNGSIPHPGFQVYGACVRITPTSQQCGTSNVTPPCKPPCVFH